jgi:hypothetical protein
MSEKAGQYQNQPDSPPTVDELKRQCHGLIEVVSKRPGAAKLLLGVLSQLEIFSQYKVTRSYRHKR